MIRVVSLRGQNLYPEDGTTVDPYVIFGSTKTQTEVIKKNSGESCEWTTLKGFEIAWDGKSKVPGPMEFHVWDYDMTGDDYIGYARLTIEPSASFFGKPKRKRPPRSSLRGVRSRQ